MDTVIVAFESDSLCRKFRDLLEGSGSAACLICHSGSQVRRAAAAQPIYCVVCGTRLSDGPAEWLCGDLPPFCSLLMVGPAHQLALCSDPDIFKLPTPIRREEALSTVSLLLQFGHRMERYTRHRRSPLEQDLIARAKALLMERDGLTEEQATGPSRSGVWTRASHWSRPPGGPSPGRRLSCGIFPPAGAYPSSRPGAPAAPRKE